MKITKWGTCKWLGGLSVEVRPLQWDIGRMGIGRIASQGAKHGCRTMLLYLTIRRNPNNSDILDLLFLLKYSLSSTNGIFLYFLLLGENPLKVVFVSLPKISQNRVYCCRDKSNNCRKLFSRNLRRFVSCLSWIAMY